MPYRHILILQNNSFLRTNVLFTFTLLYARFCETKGCYIDSQKFSKLFVTTAVRVFPFQPVSVFLQRVEAYTSKHMARRTERERNKVKISSHSYNNLLRKGENILALLQQISKEKRKYPPTVTTNYSRQEENILPLLQLITKDKRSVNTVKKVLRKMEEEKNISPN